MAYILHVSSMKGLTHSCLQQPKSPGYIGDTPSNGQKIGELFINNLSITFLRIVCKSMLNSKFIFMRMIGPEDTCHIDRKGS